MHGGESMDYERGLARLKQIVSNTAQEQDFLTYEARLRESLHDEGLYGSNEQIRADRARIIGGLNRLAAHFGTSFNDLCLLPGNTPSFQTPPKPNNATNQNAQPQPLRATPTSQRTIAYISFHPRDKAYLEELHTCLDQFARKAYWDRTKIMPGADQQKEITTALNSTKVAILLVSADFLAAEPPDYIATYELPALLQATHSEEIILLSVIVRPCAFAYSDLRLFQPVNPPNQPLSDLNQSKRAKIWLQVAEQVHDILSK